MKIFVHLPSDILLNQYDRARLIAELDGFLNDTSKMIYILTPGASLTIIDNDCKVHMQNSWDDLQEPPIEAEYDPPLVLGKEK